MNTFERIETKKSDKLVIVKLGEKQGLMDKNGKMLIEPREECYFLGLLELVGGSNDGLLFDPVIYDDWLSPFILREHFGYINENGEVVVDAVYDDAHPFSEGRGLIERNGKFGFVDTEGNEIIEPVFEFA